MIRQKPNFVTTDTERAPIVDPNRGPNLKIDLQIAFIVQANSRYDWLLGYTIVGLVTMFGSANPIRRFGCRARAFRWNRCR